MAIYICICMYIRRCVNIIYVCIFLALFSTFPAAVLFALSSKLFYFILLRLLLYAKKTCQPFLYFCCARRLIKPDFILRSAWKLISNLSFERCCGYGCGCCFCYSSWEFLLMAARARFLCCCCFFFLFSFFYLWFLLLFAHSHTQVHIYTHAYARFIVLTHNYDVFFCILRSAAWAHFQCCCCFLRYQRNEKLLLRLWPLFTPRRRLRQRQRHFK